MWLFRQCIRAQQRSLYANTTAYLVLVRIAKARHVLTGQESVVHLNHIFSLAVAKRVARILLQYLRSTASTWQTSTVSLTSACSPT